MNITLNKEKNETRKLKISIHQVLRFKIVAHMERFQMNWKKSFNALKNKILSSVEDFGNRSICHHSKSYIKTIEDEGKRANMRLKNNTRKKFKRNIMSDFIVYILHWEQITEGCVLNHCKFFTLWSIPCEFWLFSLLREFLSFVESSWS